MIGNIKNPLFIFCALFTAIFLPGLAFAAGSCTPMVTANDCAIFHPVTGDPQIMYASLCMVQANISAPLFGIFQAISAAIITPAKLLMVLYIIFFGLSFMFGFEQEENPVKFISKVFKLALMIVIISDVCFFFDNIYNFFMVTLHTLSILATTDNTALAGAAGTMAPGEAIAKGTLFGNLDVMANNLLGCKGTGIQNCRAIQGLVGIIVAFFLTGGGFIVSFMLMYGVLTVFYAFIRFFLTFGISIVALTFTLMFTPVFVCFLFWKETSDLFFNWLGLVITYTLQPIIIIFFLSFMAQILDFGSVTNALIAKDTAEGWVVPYSYSLDIVFWREVTPTIDSVKLNKGLFEDVTILNQITGASMTMPLIVLIICYTLMWLATALASLEFLKILPEFAAELSRMSDIGSPPALGASSDPEGRLSKGKFVDRYGDALDPSDGLITPGFNSGVGGDTIDKWGGKLADPLSKITARRTFGAAGRWAFRARRPTVKRDSGPSDPTIREE